MNVNPFESLPKPSSQHAADQCREMGLAVGDVIVGREEFVNGTWQEDRLTVLFIGEKLAAFKQERRTTSRPEFYADGEGSQWTLGYRAWYLLSKAA